ncbi:hypothetical protein V8F33_000004 [Rhypophila sp. PSN 637]
MQEPTTVSVTALHILVWPVCSSTLFEYHQYGYEICSLVCTAALLHCSPVTSAMVMQARQLESDSVFFVHRQSLGSCAFGG